MHDTIVTAPGSLGDVNPMLAIARVLQGCGRDVIFLAAERYLPLAQRAGLATRALIDEENFSKLVNHPRLWHPRHGARLILDSVVNEYLQSHYHWLADSFEPHKTLLVSHMLDFAGRIYRDRYPACRFVSVLPAPALLRSQSAPPRLSGLFWERWFPRRGLPLAYWCADRWIDHIGAGNINRLRLSIGLPPVKRMLQHWWWSPDLVLGLFPDWFSVPSTDLPQQMKLVGFPLADSGDVVGEQVTAEMQRILTQLDGRKPIVFAPGTAHHQAGHFLTQAAQACGQLKLPAILLSAAASQLPDSLPPGVFAASYLPFSQLLPRASAIVHHGGVGTTSQAFAAGIPQIVLPMAFDQFDNAERVLRLGCGSWLPMSKLKTSRLVRHLAGLPQWRENATVLKARFAEPPSFSERLLQSLAD